MSTGEPRPDLEAIHRELSTPAVAEDPKRLLDISTDLFGWVASLGREIQEQRARLAEENRALRAERDRLRDELGTALDQLHINRGES
jgi:hypothetical protein